MRIIHKDLKQGEVKLVPENLDDLWYLSHIIDQYDKIRGKAERKVKLGKDTEKQKIVRKQFWAAIEVEKIEFNPTADVIRLNGTIKDAIDDAPKGSYQAIEIGLGDILTIHKERWLSYHLDKLDESTKSKKPAILICVHDREDALFALFKRNSFETLSEMSGQPQKKDDSTKAHGDFYLDVIKQLQEYHKRFELQHIILASPAFFKEDLLKKLKDDSLRKIITSATCSSVSKNAINEVLKRDEVKQVLKDDRMTKESLMVEELLGEISKSGKATYGKDQVQNASNLGAIDTLLVTDILIQKMREEDTYDKLDAIMRVTEQNKGKVHIISSEHDAGKKLDGLGGLGALLRYQLSY